MEIERKDLYQGQEMSKDETEFLSELEKILGEPIPVVRSVLTERFGGMLGFVAKSGHVVELGLSKSTKGLLREIPESIGQLKHLEVLSIQLTHELMDLPESIIYLKNLKHLIYKRHPLPYIKINPDQLPNYFCSLTSLEKLDLSESSITTLPDCLAHFPNLKEINISMCLKINKLSPLIEKCFDDRQYVRPRRRFLIRRDYPQRTPEQHSITEFFSKNSEKSTKEDKGIDSILYIIREGKKLEDRIDAILALKEISFKDDSLFNFLEELLKNDKGKLVRKACADVILHKFPEKAFNVIKWTLRNESSIEIIDLIKNIIESNNLDSSLIDKDQIKDLLILNDINHALGKKLEELDKNEKFKNKYKQKSGYILKGNHISSLTLNTSRQVFNKKLIELPKTIGELEELTELNLIDCKDLTTIPESIGNLQKLTMLDCTGCRSLETVPNNIASLKNLKHLNFTKCFKLKQLPYTMTKLKNLKSFILHNCQSLTSLPQDIGDLRSLLVLDLENCRSLKQLPESITNLPNLKILCLKSCNSLEALQKDIGNLRTLKEIKLIGCTRLSLIPESIAKLNLLDSLDLSYCYSLNELPSSIGTMQNLISIVLRGCRALKTFPNKFGNLQNLETLNLYACRNIQVSPNTIKRLRALKTLDLSYCDKLLNFFEEIKDIPNLKIIKAERTPSRKSGAIDDDIGLRIYQEKVQNEIPKDEVIYYNKFTEKYISQGVIPSEAKVLAHFSVLAETELARAEIYEDIFFDAVSDMFSTHYFRINNDGHVTELYLHSPVNYYLALFPKLLRRLQYLEMIFFPDNIIKVIPEWITDLKFLRVLDVSNIDQPNPNIPDSIKSYIESLEHFNEFYR